MTVRFVGLALALTLCLPLAAETSLPAPYDDPWAAPTESLDKIAPIRVADDEAAARHEKLWFSVRSSRDPELLELFIGGFPDSPFTAEARDILASLGGGAPSVAEIAPPAPTEDADIRFSGRLTKGAAEIVGKTINQIILSSPRHPPIADLPEELWAKQLCANCHNWNRERLCEQGKTYVSLSDQVVSEKKHPFGGSFKLNLKNWATAGCQ